MKVALALTSSGLGVAAIVSIVACSGGPGTASDLRGGPDGIPKSSTDAPGTGNESPGNSSQDQPGNAAQDPGGSCITCSGNYSCVSAVAGSPTSAPSQSDSSFVTLVPGSGGCAVSSGDDDTSDQSILVCGGQFVAVENGNTILEGRWTGGNDGFTVTASANGITVNVVCSPSNAPIPQPQPVGGGSSDTLDAG